MRYDHFEGRQQHVYPLSMFIHTVETSMRDSIAASNVVAVIRKFFTGIEAGRLADDLITFNHELAAIRVHDHPLTPQQGDRAIRAVDDRNEINKRVWFIRRQ